MYNTGSNIPQNRRTSLYKVESKYESPFITESLKPIFEFAAKAAQQDDASVLIAGETGTGKE